MAIFNTIETTQSVPGLFTMDINNNLPISNLIIKQYNALSLMQGLLDGTGGLNYIHNQTRFPFTLSINNNILLKKSNKLTNKITSAGINTITDYLANNVSNNLFGNDPELGRGMGTLFSSGISSIGSTAAENVLKGNILTQGMSTNLASSLAGAGAGLAANYIGQGITSAMGDSRLGRAVGLGVSTGLGTIGGTLASNLVSLGSLLGNSASLFNGAKTITDSSGNILKAGSAINPYALGMSVVGSALGAAAGPSKEYGGKYGNITQTMDTVYDIASIGANFIPGAGQLISGAMVLNKGLSNIFGSTDGMTKTDAILGSAFMPAPVKWLNMLGSKTTDTFDKLSWLNLEKANNFMLDAFGDLQTKFRWAREDSGKTYGTFSRSAYKNAQRNIEFANPAWQKILAMADKNELQKIRSQAMSSINNLRYAQMIQGGSDPRTLIGKQGMKILNNATNHNIGMRLLSGAALIDNKQMILCNVPD